MTHHMRNLFQVPGTHDSDPRLGSLDSVIELLIYRGSTPCSVMHTAATVIAQHTANGVTHDKGWAMEDAVYSSLPRFIRFRSE
jgi:hypothetical protein